MGSAATSRPGALLLALSVLAGCGSDAPQVQEFQGQTMGTTYTIKYVATQPLPSLPAKVQQALDEFNRTFSTFIADSEISRFNAREQGGSVGLSESFLPVLRVALRIAEATGGAFDPTIMPLVRAWGFGPGGERGFPTEEELAAARSRVGWRKLDVRPDGSLQADANVELDLSAIAKGAGVDRVAGLLRELGIPGFMVEIGGEVFCAGEKGAGVAWVIGVEEPGNGALADRVPLRDRAMATSGSYRNYLEEGGRRVHHVLDPRTGMNADNRVVSVSVIAPSCALADGLATAFMVLGPQGAGKVLGSELGSDVKVLFQLTTPAGTIQRLPLDW